MKVDGEAHFEYDNVEAEPELESVGTRAESHQENRFSDTSCANNSITRYIETPDNAVFVIRWMYREPFIPFRQVHPEILLDRKSIYIPDYDLNFKNGRESWIC
jgi:hypothetical protein